MSRRFISWKIEFNDEKCILVIICLPDMIQYPDKLLLYTFHRYKMGYLSLDISYFLSVMEFGYT